METKTCTKCRECKPLDAFVKSKRAKSGLLNQCKACHSLHAAKWRAENPKKWQATAKERLAKWRAENPEKWKERAAKRNAKWRAENPEKSRASMARWRVENLESVRAKKAERARTLARTYIADLLKVPVAQLTPELLALKREQILNQRVMRELKQTLKDLTNEQQ